MRRSNKSSEWRGDSETKAKTETKVNFQNNEGENLGW
jgi:hypothetical protein